MNNRERMRQLMDQLSKQMDEDVNEVKEVDEQGNVKEFIKNVKTFTKVGKRKLTESD